MSTSQSLDKNCSMQVGDYTNRLIPSLKCITLSKIAIVIFSSPDVKKLSWKVHYESQQDTFFGLREKFEFSVPQDYAAKKVESLAMPDLLRKELVEYIGSCNWEMLLWLEYHAYSSKIVTRMPDYFFWTVFGTIDRRKTAEMMVKDESLDVIERYKLACLYCFESHIHQLWMHLLPMEFKHTILICESSEDNPALVVFWSHYLANTLKLLLKVMEECCGSKSPSPYEYAFRISIHSCNDTAARFFYGKMNPTQRSWLLSCTASHLVEKIYFDEKYTGKDFIDDFFPLKQYNRALHFFFEEMDEFLLTWLFKHYPDFLLKCFLSWPFQRLFLSLAEKLKGVVSQNTFITILSLMCKKIEYGINDWDYQQLFRQFIQLFPQSYKNGISESYLGGTIVFDLLKVKDKESISLVFNNMPGNVRESFLSTYMGELICKTLSDNRDQELMRYLIELCIPSRERALEFENKYFQVGGQTEGEYDDSVGGIEEYGDITEEVPVNNVV